MKDEKSFNQQKGNNQKETKNYFNSNNRSNNGYNNINIQMDNKYLNNSDNSNFINFNKPQNSLLKNLYNGNIKNIIKINKSNNYNKTKKEDDKFFNNNKNINNHNHNKNKNDFNNNDESIPHNYIINSNNNNSSGNNNNNNNSSGNSNSNSNNQKNYQNLNNQKSRFYKFNHKNDEKNFPKILKLSKNNFFNWKNVQILEISKQLTLVSHDLFSKITIAELLRSSRDKKKKEQALLINIVTITERFNFISDWISTIVLSAVKEKTRAKVCSKFILLAKKLLKMKNYNDMMAVMCGLQRAPVSRLATTWKRVPKTLMKSFNALDKLTSATGGYKDLRAAYKITKPPTVPWLGVYLSNLSYLEELPNLIERNLINWAKLRRTYEIVKEIKTFQRIKYRFIQKPSIIKFLQRINLMSENQMWKRSSQIL
ncbi:guanine nucleotide exchange factor [Anaeramoeba flamelloides]|uniref:Guanine nucleotide exchange factor n=1 Tax=Anaeramoeba flamelloides TaxID=1746091 RepID=A0AAV7ZI37_9EUKA|nr:guanine nucleotide exchange factor [Anaeramoeba flamelloides]